MIHIDFQGGAHGNFLEYICNVMAGVEVSGTPFNSAGASHNKKYLSPKIFYANHYSFNGTPLIYDRVISIKIDVDDLLPLSQISLLRAGDYGYDNDKLEIDTYNKLNNKSYRWVLDILLDTFFTGQIQNSYNAVKDPLWPNVSTLEEFRALPEHIQNECKEVHKLELLELNKSSPNCPRQVLREFFQIGFDAPMNHGFMTQQNLIKYKEQVNVYIFPFRAFYNAQQFIDHTKSIADWAGLSYNNQDKITELHKLFLEKQPYKDSKNKCDQIVQQLIENKIQPPKLNLIEEAYVNSMLNKHGHECRY